MAFVMLLPVLTANPSMAAINPSDPFITGVNIVLEGYEPIPLGLNAVYNASIPPIGLEAASFTDASQSSSDLASDGITRTYSDSYLGAIINAGYSSASGIYQTLKGIQEDEFSQYTTDREVTVFNYYAQETFDQTINDTMNAINPDWSDQNFTCGDMYALITFDKALVDAFFTDAKAKSTFGDVADLYSTNQQMITTLLDDVFGLHLFDIIYAPINETAYATAWTLDQEVRSVLGGNDTDSSLDGATKIVSVRNAMVGYIGQNIAADSVVGSAAAIGNPSTDAIFGFTATATTYTIKFRIKADFVSSPVASAFNSLFTIIQPGTEAGDGILVAVNWNMVLGISLGVAAVVAVITIYATRKKGEKSLLYGLIAFAVVGLVLLAILILSLGSFAVG